MNIIFDKLELNAALACLAKERDHVALSHIKIQVYEGGARVLSCDTFRLHKMEQGDCTGDPTREILINKTIFRALAIKTGSGRTTQYILDTDMIKTDGETEGLNWPQWESIVPNEDGKNIIQISPNAVHYAAPYGVNFGYLGDLVKLVGDSTVWCTAAGYAGQDPLRAEFQSANFKVLHVISPVCLCADDARDIVAAQDAYIEGIK